MSNEAWMTLWKIAFVGIFGAYLLVALGVAIRGTPQMFRMLQSIRRAPSRTAEREPRTK